MKRILKFAAGKTQADMGEEMFATGSISTPALIFMQINNSADIPS